MVLGGEIQNPWRTQAPIEIRLSELYLPSFAEPNVIIEHIRESLLELKGNAFTHNANAVDGIDQRLRFRREKIPDPDSYHDCLLT